MREDVFYHVVEMLRDHKDLQQLPQCNDVTPFISSFFTIPEIGRLSNFGQYKMNNKHVIVEIWGSTKYYRFTWKKLIPYLKNDFERQYLF